MLSLVLPAYNEAENIEIVVNEALTEIPQLFERYEIIVVDDGSKDKTGEIVDRLAAAHPGIVRVVHHNPNRGYGAALSTGFRTAQGDYLMFMDSDRQFKAVDLQLFAPYIGTADIVAGYRKKRNDPWYRFLIGYTFNFAVTLLFDIHLRDIDCGFKVFKAEFLKGLELTSPGALINTEIQAKAKQQGRSIIEVGVNHYPRLVGEQSGASVRVITRATQETIRLWWRMRNYIPPQATLPNTLRPVARATSLIPSVNLAALSLGVGLFLGWLFFKVTKRVAR